MGCVWQPSHPLETQLEFGISFWGCSLGGLSHLVLFLQSSAILPLPWEKLRKNATPKVGFVGLEVEVDSGGGVVQDCKKKQ